jgi:hypothetical protein
MFGKSDEITFDARSGRPLAPLSFRTARVWMALGSAMSALLLVIAIMTARDNQIALATITALASIGIFAFVIWHQREIVTKHTEYKAMLETYENVRYQPTTEQESGSGA